MGIIDERQAATMSTMLELNLAPYTLRLVAGDVLEVREREEQDDKTVKYNRVSVTRGALLRHGYEALKMILLDNVDEQNRPLEVWRLFTGRVTYRGEIPITETIGIKLALWFALVKGMTDIERSELIGWRILAFSREEASYWLSKIRWGAYGERQKEWARKGLRVVLCGDGIDRDGVREMLIKARR